MTDKEAPPQDHVLIIGAGDLVMPAFRIAREELGLGVIALDYDPQAPGMGYADEALLVSTKDVPAAVAASIKAAKSHRIAGVFTCGADVEVTVAAVAEALGLPGIPLEAARRCNDKVLMHNFLDQQGFTEKPDYRVVADANQACRAAREIGFPCVIKPIDNCASRGVQRLDGPEEMTGAYDLAASFNGSGGGEVLIEECLRGSKHTVEMIAYQGQTHLLSIIDTHYISPRWPCETGLNTTTQPLKAQRRIFDFAKEVGRLMGSDFNAHKVDINIEEGGRVRLIELTARLSGGFHCQYASPLAFGSHDIRASLRLALGQGLDREDIRHRYEKGAAVRAIFPQPGRVASISGVEEARTALGVDQVFVWCQAGDVVGPYKNSADRVAFVIAGGETTAGAVANAERAAGLIEIATVPVGEGR